MFIDCRQLKYSLLGRGDISYTFLKAIKRTYIQVDYY